MNYIVVQLKCDKSLSMNERKAYIDTFYNKYPHTGENKLGFFSKFSSAIGFKKDDSHTPQDFLVEESYAYPTGNSIIEFYFPKNEKIYNDFVSYSTDKIASKWANFLSKIFPQLEVSIVEENAKPTRETFLISFLFKIIEEYPIASDISLKTKLTEQELKSIEKLLNSYEYDLKFKLFQFECDTCKEYDPERPIHLELDISMKYSNDENHIKRCYNCITPMTVDKDFCDECEKIIGEKLILKVN